MQKNISKSGAAPKESTKQKPFLPMTVGNAKALQEFIDRKKMEAK